MFNLQTARWDEERILAVLFFVLEFVQSYLFLLDPAFGWDIDWTG